MQVSETFFKNLENKLGKNKLDGYYETFNNNREQGYVLSIHKDSGDFIIWACESRNSDDIMIVIGNEKNINSVSMFDDDTYQKAHYFHYHDYDSAVDYVYKQLRTLFKDDLKFESHIKFDCYYGIDDIRRIYVDAKDLNYEDYYDIATYYDEDERFFCDLVIINGEFGLRYSNKDKDGNIENIHFEPCVLNLDSMTTLMLNMQEKLNKFIEDEYLYSVEMNTPSISI